VLEDAGIRYETVATLHDRLPDGLDSRDAAGL
jgi:hypothetical protein